MKKEDVVEAVKSTFSNVLLGNGVGLWEAQTIDDYETKDVQRKNRKKGEKEDWGSISHDEL